MDAKEKVSSAGQHIRAASIADVAAIDEANRALLPENYPLQFYEQFFASQHCCNYVVVDPDDGSKIAAYILAAAENDNKGQLIAHVFSIAVYPKFQRRGFATLLLSTVENVMKKRYPSLKYVSLHVRKSNKTALLFYCKQGYNRSKVEKAYYKNKVEDGLLMKKYLE